MVVVSIAIFDDQRLDGATASVQFGQVKWLWSSGSWMWQRWLPETLTAGQSSPWGTCQHQKEQRSDGHWTLPPLWNRDAMHNARSNQSIGIPSRIVSLEILETGDQSISLDMAHPRLLASIYIYATPLRSTFEAVCNEFQHEGLKADGLGSSSSLLDFHFCMHRFLQAISSCLHIVWFWQSGAFDSVSQMLQTGVAVVTEIQPGMYSEGGT